jgi:hypothetical protein
MGRPCFGERPVEVTTYRPSPDLHCKYAKVQWCRRPDSFCKPARRQRRHHCTLAGFAGFLDREHPVEQRVIAPHQIP